MLEFLNRRVIAVGEILQAFKNYLLHFDKSNLIHMVRLSGSAKKAVYKINHLYVSVNFLSLKV